MDECSNRSRRGKIGIIMVNVEWIVEVDVNDNFLDKIDRIVAHDKTDLRLHREVMILLYTDPSRQHFLLQRRSLEKKQWGGFWTLSATGHVDFTDISRLDTDGYLTAAMREVKEEIGVKAKHLKLVGKIIQENAINHALMGIVMGEYSGELNIESEEVSEVREFTKETLSKADVKLTPGAKACLEYLGILKK